MRSSAHADGDDDDDRVSRGRIYQRNIGSLGMGIWLRRISRLIGGLISFLFFFLGRGEGLIALKCEMEWDGRGEKTKLTNAQVECAFGGRWDCEAC